MNVEELIFLLTKLVDKGYGKTPVRWLPRPDADMWNDGERVTAMNLVKDVVSEDSVVLLS